MIWTIIVFLLLAVIFLLYRQFKRHFLFEQVKWCVSSDSMCNMRDKMLSLQRELDLDDKYRITSDEANVVAEILESYRKDLVRKYFDGVLSNCRFVEDVSFVIALNDYLEMMKLEIERGREFNGHEMYTIKGYQSHSSCGEEQFTRTYALSDYAVTFCKLYYISQLYFLRIYKIVEENTIGVLRAEEIKKEIDTREFRR